MALCGEDYYCCQFQPNTFDPSRCCSCLRPDHMHLSSTTAAAKEDADDDDGALSQVTTSGTSDDISGGWTYEWSLVRSLSPDWELNICDTDTQSSSPVQWDCPGRSGSLSPERHCVARRDMTRLDPSPHRASDSAQMDETRDRGRSRQTSESRGDRVQESGYFSPDRRGNGGQQMEEVNKRPFRYYERGRPLPSNHSPEPKACVPFRNVNLGVPSQRRNTDTFIQETWRSESPQRYTYHSNFRGGTKSQDNSPARHYSKSPDRNNVTESPLGSQRHSSHSRSQTRSHIPSHDPSQVPSRTLSRHTSGRSSPSRKSRSFSSRPASPSRASPSHRHTDSHHLHKDEFEHIQRGRSRESRRPSQASNSHSLDSEKLYRNLESISRRGSSAIQPNSYKGSQESPRTRTAVNSSANTRTRNSHEISPSRSDRGTHSHTPQRESHSRDIRPDTAQTYSKRPNEVQDKSISSPPQGSWQGSSHSLLSLASRGSSPSRRGVDSKLLAHSLKSHAETLEVDWGNETNKKVNGDRSRSNMRQGLGALVTSEPKKTSAEEVGMTIGDYVILADIPRIHLESEEESLGQRRRNQSLSPRRDQRLRTPRYQDEVDAYSSRVEPDERGRGRERGRDRREKCRDSDDGRLSRRQSTTSLHMQSSDNQSEKLRSSEMKKRARRGHTQTQEWMSKLDENGKWRKHWFVLDEDSLKYYRDSEAEESDDLDGEIDLTSCVNVSDCDVEKNYGFQIHTKRAVFTLSAMTSRIRRNWVKLLKQVIQNNTHQSDTSSEKESPLSRRPSSCQPPARLTCKDSSYETNAAANDSNATAANSCQGDQHQTESIDRDLEAAPRVLSPATQREAGEGWDREQAKRLEERNKWFEEGIPLSEMGSRWDSMELKKGSVPVPVTDTLDSELNRKWSEFERMSFRDMSAQSLIGAQTHQSSTPEAFQSPISSQTYQSSPEEAFHSVVGSQTDTSSSKEAFPSVNGAQTIQTTTAEALQREAISLRQQVESIKKERVAMGMEVDSPCGPGAPCRARMEAMEAAHRKALQELQEKHTKEMRELEDERDRILQEESQAAAKAVETLRMAHREELGREVEQARRLAGGGALVDTVHRGQTPQADILHSELDVMSERYSQKCLELSRTEQSSKGRESELSYKEREMEQLRRENQELKSRLAEEISRMRYFITGQRAETASLGNTDRSPSEVEILLRAKENEVQYLQKEISCLQSEVQSLTKEKEAAYERYKEAYVELSEMKSRSQLEVGSLNEHLRLANAALQEGARGT